MKEIYKPYERNFLLEPTKLARLIDKIHERLSDHQHTTTHDSFEVFLSGKQHEKMTSVDQVLALENSRKHKIQRLLIICSAATKGAVRPEYEIQVDFGKNKSATRNTKIVEVSVRSEDDGWASRTLSEVEEQLERTWLQYGLPGGAMIGLLVCILVVFTSQFVTVGAGPRAEDVAHAMWLRAPDLDHVQQILSQNRTITDEEMREIATRQLQNVLEDQRPKQSPQKTWTRQRILVVVPLMILLGCVVTLLACCYPSAVFLWGDEVGRYGTVMQRRRTIWNIIIGMTIIGVVANLFSASLVSWLPPE